MLVLLISCMAFALAYVLAGLGERADAKSRAAPDFGWLKRFGPAWRSSRTARVLHGIAGRVIAQVPVRRRAGDDLPEMLDIVGLGLTAGLSFDAALLEYCHENDSELALGLRSAMLAWQMGLSSRHDALVGLSERLGEPGIARFAGSVTEALELGTPLVATLSRQAKLARDEQRARVEERIEKVPVKMLVPMGTLVVPAMLLAIVGPLVAAMSRG